MMSPRVIRMTTPAGASTTGASMWADDSTMGGNGGDFLVEYHVESAEELLGKDPHTAWVLKLAKNKAKATKFSKVTATGTLVGDDKILELDVGIAMAKKLCDDKDTENDKLIEYYQLQIKKCQQQKTITEDVRSNIIPATEKLLSEATDLKLGKRPAKLTRTFLTQLFARNKVSVVGHPLAFIAKMMFLLSWDDIGNLDHDECREVIAFLSAEHFQRNPEFVETLQLYSSLGIIGADFCSDTIMGSAHNTLGTLHALLGIYLHQLPPGAEDFIFVRKNKNGGAEEICWHRKTDPVVANNAEQVPTFAGGGVGAPFGGGSADPFSTPLPPSPPTTGMENSFADMAFS